MTENVNIVIKAFDKTKQALASVQSNLAKVGLGVKSLQSKFPRLTSVASKSFGAMKRAAGALGNKFKGLVKSLFSMRTAFVLAAGATAIGALIKSSLNSADALAKTADKLGMTTEALAGLRLAAELTGVSTGTMDMAMQRLTRRVAEAAQGTGEAKGALKELGLNAQELVKMPLDEQMQLIAEQMGGVETQADKVRLAMKLFDSEGVALVNTLALGADGLVQMASEAEHLGLALSRTDTAQIEAANDAITRSGKVFKGLGNQLAVAFAPIIEGVANLFRQSSLDSAEFGNIGQRVADGLVAAFVVLRRVLHIIEILVKKLLLGMMKLAVFMGDILAPIFDGWIFLYNKLAKLPMLGLSEIDTTGAEQIDKIIANVEKLEAEISGLLEADPGGDIAKAYEKIVVSSRVAAQAVAKAKTDALAVSDENNWADDLTSSIEKAIGTIPSLAQSLDKFTKGAMDTFTNSFTAAITGAKDFASAIQDMAKSIIDSLIKMLVQFYITQPLFEAFKSFAGNLGGGGGGGGSSGGRAIGGSVQAGQPYTVGERGQEMFVPNQSGSIIPNDKLSGGKGVTINQTINVTTGIQSTVRAEIASLMPQIAQAAKGAVVDARLRGGNFSKAMGG